MNNKFVTYPGTFLCKECKQEVKSLRFYLETGTISWLCSNKHLTKVELVPQKKSKKDYENE